MPIRVYHACEHIKKTMKVHSGLVGISNNPNARQSLFLVTPELARIAKEYKSQYVMETSRKVGTFTKGGEERT